jgi:hypothetical protein
MQQHLNYTLSLSLVLDLDLNLDLNLDLILKHSLRMRASHRSPNVSLLIKAVTVVLVDHLLQRSQLNVLHLVFSGGPFFETSLGEHCLVEVLMCGQDEWMTMKLLFSTPDHHVKQICHQFSLPLNH